MNLTVPKAIEYLKRFPETCVFHVVPTAIAGELNRVVCAVSLAFHESPSAVLSKTKVWTTAEARHAVVWVLRRRGMTHKAISRAMGRLCHGTSVKSNKRAEQLASCDAAYRERLSAAERILSETKP